MLAWFSEFLHSDDFRTRARRPEFPTAFTRNRKLPLPALVAFMLGGLRKSVQTELDEFFGRLHAQAGLLRAVTEQAFALARAKLAPEALHWLNERLLAQAEASGAALRWNGLRVVVADGSPLRLGLRASHVPRAARVEQWLFGLFLPGVELMLWAGLHSPREGERQVLFENLHRLVAGDLLVLDRGYPATWLCAVLEARGIAYCMRVEKDGDNGFACVRRFLASGLSEQIVELPVPSAADARDFGCPRHAPRVRLLRQVAPNGRIRCLMTNLLDTAAVPASAFRDLYHQRWRIEEAFDCLSYCTPSYVIECQGSTDPRRELTGLAPPWRGGTRRGPLGEWSTAHCGTLGWPRGPSAESGAARLSA